MFHAHDGLCFLRRSDGSVEIIKYRNGLTDEILFSTVLTKESWASIVSSMTALGESGPLYRAIVGLQL